jgi:hypothetical protein
MGRKLFEREYCTEEELLAITNNLI